MCSVRRAIEAEIRKSVEASGGRVFKLDIDEVSILLSVDIVAGDALSRKATYVPYSAGLLAGAFEDVRSWLRTVTRG